MCSLTHTPLPHKHAVTPAARGPRRRREGGRHAPPTDPAEREDVVSEEDKHGEHEQDERPDPRRGAGTGLAVPSQENSGCGGRGRARRIPHAPPEL